LIIAIVKSSANKMKMMLSVLLTAILLAPIIIQGMHRHSHSHCCHISAPDGLNRYFHHHDHHSCGICSFEILPGISNESVKLPSSFSTEADIEFIYKSSAELFNPVYARLRAPPVA
jgi:hypothetical protein